MRSAEVPAAEFFWVGSLQEWSLPRVRQPNGSRWATASFGTGDMSRDGCWAERVAVDHRVVAAIPDQLSFADAASLPIGAATAWEAIFRDQDKLFRPASIAFSCLAGREVWARSRPSS